MPDFDVAVIGAGPGGYVAALRAAQAGLRVACIDERPTAGGTCLNVGCIPSKALLSSTEHGAELKSFADHSIETEASRFDLVRMMARKERVVSDVTKGIAFLFKKAGVEFVQGHATVIAPGRVTVDGREVAARHILIATGSEPATLPGVPFDEKLVLSSTGTMSLDKVPEKLVVIGAGVIGLKLGPDLVTPRRQGDRGRISRPYPARHRRRDRQECAAASRPAGRWLHAEHGGRGDCCRWRDGQDQNRKPLLRRRGNAGGGCRLVAIGRRPRTAGLGLEALGLQRDVFSP